MSLILAADWRPGNRLSVRAASRCWLGVGPVTRLTKQDKRKNNFVPHGQYTSNGGPDFR